MLKKDRDRTLCLKHIFLPLLTMHYVKIIENDRFRDRLVSKYNLRVKNARSIEINAGIGLIYMVACLCHFVISFFRLLAWRYGAAPRRNNAKTSRTVLAYRTWFCLFSVYRNRFLMFWSFFFCFQTRGVCLPCYELIDS